MRLKRYSSKIIKIPKVCSKLCGRLDKFGFNKAVFFKWIFETYFFTFCILITGPEEPAGHWNELRKDLAE